MMNNLRLLAVLAALGLTPDDLRAAEFSNSYIRFALPDGWQCALEVDSFVCHEIGEEANRPSILIVTAKEANPTTDNFDVYAAEVSRPRRMQNSSGQVYTSRPDPARQESIGGRDWIVGASSARRCPGTIPTTTRRSKVEWPFELAPLLPGHGLALP
jgi:hypothetical protein